ncbi:MAG: ATP-dependent DNA helicase [Propionibacteriaceae bacterium]|jgi:ATP-dependent DNA helicase DinG|nr:ATP-dependent DNA helicase [Propionibacteriaceae bacterium]
MSDPDLTHRLLLAAVERLGGSPRDGQIEMAACIDRSWTVGHHAMIQAGTGTGKSLGYLVPAVATLCQATDQAQVVVATATLALQTQLANKDLPTVLAAADDLDLPAISWSVLKGAANYICLLKTRDAPLDPSELQPSLTDVNPDPAQASTSDLGGQVLELRSWAKTMVKQAKIADRDEAPSHSPRAWAQVSVNGRECIGSSCPYVNQCFVMAARERSAKSQLVITNHALVAVEAERGWASLHPEALIIDEAHELESRVTTARTAELRPSAIDRLTRLVKARLTDATLDSLIGAAQRFADALEMTPAGRLQPGEVTQAAGDLRASLRQVISGLGKDDADPHAEQLSSEAQGLFEACERVAALSEDDVVWVAKNQAYGVEVLVAPLSVAQAIRGSILDHQPTVLTSATLALAGSFDAINRSVGLPADGSDADECDRIDVGSPFDYASQGICYIGADLEPPGRDGPTDATLTEVVDLVEASGGHALGLFSSMRAAQLAADHLRSTTSIPVLVQGEGHLPELIRQFLDDGRTCLFGTISLWQGVDAPGSTCHLVIVDRIPFPRPDEPLIRARQDQVSRHGGNGFMQVAASHAALMLAQGTGRLIRSVSDRGVVAILDSRLATARYGRFLLAAMPPLWRTTDRALVLAALRRLNISAAQDQTDHVGGNRDGEASADV